MSSSDNQNIWCCCPTANYIQNYSMRDRMCNLMITDDLLEFESPSSILAEVSSGDLDVLSDLESDENCEQDDCNRSWDSS